MTKTLSKGLLLVLVVCSGCGWLVKPAGVELVGLAFPNENMVDLTVLIHNRNRFSARASDMEYKVSIGGEVIGRGHTPQVLSIGGRDSLVTHFPMNYDMAAMARVLPQILQDTVVVRVDGTYRLRSVVSRPKLSFSTERRIPIKARLGGVFKSLLGSDPGKGK
jgi:LEA14-like dessication related protein